MASVTSHRTETRIALKPAAVRGAVRAATLLLLAVALQSCGLHAELLFRNAEERNGQQVWSEPRKFTNPMDLAGTRGHGGQAAAEEVQVFLQGYISAADVDAAKVLEELIKQGRQRIAGNAVSLASNGGEINAAMELGRLLRKIGVSTIVAQGDQCLSSCVFAFMGGSSRTAAGRIGIHRPFFSSTLEVADRRGHYRQVQKRLQEYIDELDFPYSLYEAVMAVPPEAVSVLAPVDLKRFYLEGMSPSTQEEADAASARVLGITVLEYLQRKAAASGNAAYDPGRKPDAQMAPEAGALRRAAEEANAPAQRSGTGRRTPGSPRASF